MPDTEVSAEARIERAAGRFLDLLWEIFPEGSREISVARTHIETAKLWAQSYARTPEGG